MTGRTPQRFGGTLKAEEREQDGLWVEDPQETVDTAEIDWREWSTEAFEEAAREDKLVLLDLTATWCHWCHVMDDTTYSDPGVVALVNDNFVPVRVDIDRRPDVSERYNRGGFPTTAFLSARGEPVWGATYIPPSDMRRIIGSVLKAQRSGEIGQALEKVRGQLRRGIPLRVDRGLPASSELDSLFADVFASYDLDHGGFGTEPKFPHPDAVDIMIDRHLEGAGGELLASAVRHTLTSMAEGLYDDVEGGVFRYSVTRDWSVPHYEKMLETNLGYLRNLARAHVVFGDDLFRGLAEGVAGYLTGVLMDRETGGFYGSQDADEAYYGLSLEGRAGRGPPSVDRTVFAGWNGLAASVMTEAGSLMERADWVDAGLSALDRLLRRQFDEGRGLVRHIEGGDLVLFEDQADLLGALVSTMGIPGRRGQEETALTLVEGVKDEFAHDAGGFGDVSRSGEDTGELAFSRRSLVANSKWAHQLSMLGVVAGRPDLVDEASEVLGSFDKRTVEAHGVFSAPYFTASKVVIRGPAKVEVHAPRERQTVLHPLWRAAKRSLDQGVATVFVDDAEDFAVVCTMSGCSGKTEDAAGLLEALRRRSSG